MTGATGTTEDDISEEEDVHRQAANRQGKMLYIQSHQNMLYAQCKVIAVTPKTLTLNHAAK